MKTLESTHVLRKIVEAKRRRIADLKMRVPEAIVRKMASVQGPAPSFRAALEGPATTRIIAEIKKASPSKGVLIDLLDVEALAKTYGKAGASAISVVTEEDYFQGDLGWVRLAANASGLPVLRKDFLFEPYQLWESRAAGASAVLLIAAMLQPAELRALLETAREFQLDALVEVHDEEELSEALGAGASIVGVNNRDLKTFDVCLDTSLRLGARIPDDRIFVAESGIHHREDVEKLAGAGAAAFLVGEYLLSTTDPGDALRSLL